MDLCSFDTARIAASQLCYYYYNNLIIWFPVAIVFLLKALYKHTKNDGLLPEAPAVLSAQQESRLKQWTHVTRQ